ncbi:MAG: bacillithiol system redox-active protein YtxJ [Bacteroidota bacterium]|nr:bacillithiol system redox-active protein YtxJ [Bacteroidota bacterium]
MQWNKIIKEENLMSLNEESFQNPVIIFKHSTRCSISAMALDRMKRSWNEQEVNSINPYYLDIIAFRPLSTKIAQDYNVEHESPQLLMIYKGVCVYNASHMEISYQEIKRRLQVSNA